MKKTNLIVLVLLVVSTLVFFYLKNQDRSTNLEITPDFFQVKDTQEVSKVFITNIEGNNTIIEREKHYWTINGKYRADRNAINNMFEPLVKIRVKAPVGNSNKDELIKNMTINTQKIEIYRAGKLTRTLYIGNATADGTGTYIYSNDDGLDRPYIVSIPGWNGSIGPRFFTKEMAWRSKRVFNFAPIQISQLTVDYKMEPQASFTLKNMEGGKVEVLPVYEVQQPITNPKETLIKSTFMSTANLYYEDFLLPSAKSKTDSVLNILPVFATIEIENKNQGKLTLILKEQPIEDDQSELTGGLAIDRFYAYLDGQEKPEIGLLQLQMAAKLLKNFDRFENAN